MQELMCKTDAPQTMSSREIAELTGKQHNNVCRDIVKMLEGLEVCTLKFESTYNVPGPNGGTRAAREFRLPKRETLILVSGYNVQMRARIIDRWQELEWQVAAPPQLTREQQLASALLLSQEVLAEKDALIAKQAHTIEQQAPAVEFTRAVVENTEETESLHDFSARCRIGEYRLFALLREERIIHRADGGGHQPERRFIESGYFQVREGKPYRKTGPRGGAVVTYKKVLITKKGLAYMWRRFGTFLFESEAKALGL